LDALGGKKRNRWGDVMVGETTEGHRVECRGRRMVRSGINVINLCVTLTRGSEDAIGEGPDDG